jgi:hypothetical protein
MRNLIILCGLLFLCSCSVLKKSKESHASSSSDLQQGSKSTTSLVDTSKKTTTEHWKLTVPGSFTLKPGDLPKFEPLPVIILPGANKEQAAAYSDLQGKYNKLVSAYNDKGKALDQSEALGQGFQLELFKRIEELNGKSASSNQQDSLKHKQAQQVDNKETSKQVDWDSLVWKVCGTVIVLFMLKQAFK